MEKPRTIFFIALLTTGLSSCGLFESENSLEKENKQLAKVLDGFFVTYWKGAKLSIRSLPITRNTQSIDFDKVRKEQSERFGFGHQLSRIYDWEMFLKDGEAHPEEFSVKELIELAKDIYAISDTLKDLDEDDYPTVIEIISNSNTVLNKKSVKSQGESQKSGGQI